MYLYILYICIVLHMLYNKDFYRSPYLHIIGSNELNKIKVCVLCNHWHTLIKIASIFALIFLSQGTQTVGSFVVKEITGQHVCRTYVLCKPPNVGQLCHQCYLSRNGAILALNDFSPQGLHNANGQYCAYL